MKTRNTLIGLGVAAALVAGVGAFTLTASAQGGSGYSYGPGMMDGYGPSYGQGYGLMHGYGPGYGHMRGYDSDATATKGKATAPATTCAIVAANTAPA